VNARSEPRVVSLVPSVTETLLAWGVTPAACTRFCVQPELRHVGGTKDPHIDEIVGVRPDLVVMCVEENRREDADALTAAGVDILALSIDGVDDVAPALRMLAQRVGVDPDRVPELPDVDGASSPGRPRLRAFVPVWKRPWMSLAGGTYGSSLLAAIGVDNVFADASDRYPTVTLEDARARHPDVVLAPSEPYPFRERHVPILDEVAPAVLVDGQDLFWWGARTPAAIERLSEVVRSGR